MTNQRDDGFKDKNNADDIFASDDDPMNETFDAHRLADIVDIETDDASGDISDYDDTDDGIFAPPPQKKKSNSSALLGTVAVIAIVGAGGFAFYKNPDFLSSLMASTSRDVAVTQDVAPQPDVAVQPAVVNTETPVDGTAATAPTASLDETDAELLAIPQPQPIANEPQAVVQDDIAAQQVAAAPDKPVIGDPAPVADTPVTVEPKTEPAPVVVEGASTSPVTQAPTDMPAPPTPEETKAVAAVPVTTPDTTAVPVAPADTVRSAAPQVKITTTKTPVIDLTGAPEPVAAVPPAPDVLKPVPDVAMEDPIITPDIKPAPKPKVETVYYDAPKGKAMSNIPTPSLNVKRDKNESIIVVDQAITATSQESAITSAGRALRLGRYDAALEMYNSLYRANPRDARILMGRAVTLQKMGQTGSAIDAYEEVLNVDQDNPEAIVNLMGLIRKQYPARALEKLLDLRASNPDNPGIMAQLGIAYADSGNFEDAVKYVMMASKAEPNNPQHYFNLGVISERMKNRPRAIAFYEKALETDAIYGTGRGIDRDMIYDRLTRLRN